jgi:hypothetical protein
VGLLGGVVPLGVIGHVMKWVRTFLRPSIRRLMIAVAVTAPCLAVGPMLLRHERSRRRADAYHQQANAEYLASHLIFSRHHHGPSVPEKQMMEAHERLGAHYEMLSEKYARAAWRPWLHIGPDPPASALPADVHF